MGRIAGVCFALTVAAIVLTPLGRYLARAAFEEGKILLRRRPIDRLVTDTTTPPDVRARLELVREARNAADGMFGLRAGKSFTTYSALETDTLVMVLSAAARDQLVPYTWWFPVVGRMPYKGFFDPVEGSRAASALEAAGFDTELRPASAFSTLGWFNDPLLSTTLSADTTWLVNTVFHELTHNTFFARGQTTFNESFASFVGARAAEQFFRARRSPAAAEAVRAAWDDDKLLSIFWSTTYAALDSAFRAHPSDRDARLAAREEIYARARALLVDSLAPRFQRLRVDRATRLKLNNATLMARRVYYTDLALFDDVFDREGKDVRKTIERVLALVRDAKNPYQTLRDWLRETSQSR